LHRHEEPDVGSDLASVAPAAKVQGGYLVNGTKFGPASRTLAIYDSVLPDWAGGDSQGIGMAASAFLVDLRNTPGITIRPISR